MWFAYALLAAILWGLTYALTEQIYKHISVATFLTIVSFVIFLILGLWTYYTGMFQRDLAVLSVSKNVLGLVLAAVVTVLAAEVLIGLSISGKNATFASLIEISYPFFIALFSALLFGVQHLNGAVLLGGIMILFGVSVIYAFGS